MNTCNVVSDHLNLIDNWLSNDKTTFFNFLNNKKQNKFINQFLKASRNESNSTNGNINSSINKVKHRNQNLSNSEQISTSQKPTVHLITQPTSKTNKKKKRQYHKGRSVKANCVYRDLVVNLSNYQLTDDEIKVLARGLKFIPSPRNINKTEVLVDIKKFGRRMRLKEFFHERNNSTESETSDTNEDDYETGAFRKSSTFTPKPNREPALDLYLKHLENSIMKAKP